MNFHPRGPTETICTNLAAGTYYLAVESQGNYGDLGQYNITGTLVVPPQLPTPPTITGMSLTPSGQFKFQFAGNTNASYSVLISTNVALSVTNWLVLGQATLSNGVFQFADPGVSNSPARFYQVRSP